MIPLRRRAWGTHKPPLGARLNAGHPLARGMRALVLFNEGGGNPHNLVTGAPAPSTNGPTWTANQAGRAGYASATNQYWQIDADDGRMPTERGTVILIKRKVTTATVAQQTVAVATGDNPEQLVAYVPFLDGNVYWDFGSVRINYAWAATTDVEYWAFVAGPAGSAIYLNSVAQVATGTAASRVPSGQPVYINKGVSFDGDVQEYGLVGILDAEWSQRQVREWVTEPYAFLAPPGPRVRYFFAEAGAAAHTLNADPGTYTLTGSAATLAPARRLTADPGTYTATGSAAALSRTRALTVAPGTYALTGASAALLATRLLSADPATYALTGSAASLARGAKVAADPGTYALTGSAATLEADRVLSADPGTYAVSGAAATLTKTSNASLIWLRVRR